MGISMSMWPMANGSRSGNMLHETDRLSCISSSVYDLDGASACGSSRLESNGHARAPHNYTPSMDSYICILHVRRKEQRSSAWMFRIVIWEVLLKSLANIYSLRQLAFVSLLLPLLDTGRGTRLGRGEYAGTSKTALGFAMHIVAGCGRTGVASVLFNQMRV